MKQNRQPNHSSKQSLEERTEAKLLAVRRTIDKNIARNKYCGLNNFIQPYHNSERLASDILFNLAIAASINGLTKDMYEYVDKTNRSDLLCKFLSDVRTEYDAVLLKNDVSNINSWGQSDLVMHIYDITRYRMPFKYGSEDYWYSDMGKINFFQKVKELKENNK